MLQYECAEFLRCSLRTHVHCNRRRFHSNHPRAEPEDGRRRHVKRPISEAIHTLQKSGDQKQMPECHNDPCWQRRRRLPAFPRAAVLVITVISNAGNRLQAPEISHLRVSIDRKGLCRSEKCIFNSNVMYAYRLRFLGTARTVNVHETFRLWKLNFCIEIDTSA